MITSPLFLVMGHHGIYWSGFSSFYQHCFETPSQPRIPWPWTYLEFSDRGTNLGWAMKSAPSSRARQSAYPYGLLLSPYTLRSWVLGLNTELAAEFFSLKMSNSSRD